MKNQKVLNFTSKKLYCFFLNTSSIYLKVTEDEKPNLEEEIEQISEISFETQFTLEPAALNGMTFEDAELEIAKEMKARYASLNPFEDGEVIINVDIQMTEVCKEISPLSSELIHYLLFQQLAG